MGKGQFDAFELFVLAMAHQRLGHRPEARAGYDRSVRWRQGRKALSQQQSDELAAFRAETEAVLAIQIGDLPVKVFAP